MAKAMTYPEVFRVLMNGGYICYTWRVQRASVISVREASGESVGHITASQFEQLVFLMEELRRQSRPEKGGDITGFWQLNRPCEALRKRWKDIEEEEKGASDDGI